MADELNDADYAALAGFRFELRRFLRFSEEAAQAVGLTSQQHQALLAIRARGEEGLRVGTLAEHLLLKPHSASELVHRLVDHGLLIRQSAAHDRRQVRLILTDHARDILASLSVSHRRELQQVGPLLKLWLGEL